MKNKIIALLLSIFAIININSISYANNFSHENTVNSMLVGNVESGEVYYSKQDEKGFPAASMSKMMTYLIIKDEIKAGKISMDDIVTITSEAAKYNLDGYSRFDLSVGEKVKVSDLLKATMIVSGNDAAVALAVHSAGSEAKFVTKMNNKAKEIGLSNSSFINATGITEGSESEGYKNNLMSAKDLFTIARHIITKYPETIEYGKTDKLVVPERNYASESTLPLRDERAGLEGLKTGYTPQVGYGFTGLFNLDKEKKGQKFKIITVVMGAETEEQRKTTTSELVDFVLNNYKYTSTFNTEKPIVDIKDSNTNLDYIPLYPEKNFNFILKSTDSVDYEYKVFENNKAPYEDGEALGEVVLRVNGEVKDKVNLINKGYVPKINIFQRIRNMFTDLIENILLLF